MELCVKKKGIRAALLIMLWFVSSSSVAHESVTDSALWSGGLVLWDYKDSLDYSVEYQLRLARLKEQKSKKMCSAVI